MPKGLVGNAVQEFNHATEGIRRSRRQWKTEMIPELCAWLQTQIRMTRSTLAKMRTDARSTSSVHYAAMIRALEDKIDLLNDLVGCVADPWPDWAWYPSVTEVAAALGIQDRKPIDSAVRLVQNIPHLEKEGDDAA